MSLIDTLYPLVYWVHVPVALSCIPAFWTALASRKGGPVHVGAGRWFAHGMRFVAVSGAAMALVSLVDPFARGPGPSEADSAAREAFAASTRTGSVFLLYLAVITFVPVHHGVRLVRTRRAPSALGRPAHRLLVALPLLSSVGLAAAAFAFGGPLASGLLAMSAVGVVETWIFGLQVARAARPGVWRTSHLTAMAVAGIAVHTAFAVFVVGRVLDVRMPGVLAALPWALPSLVGVPWMLLAARREARRLGAART